MVSSPSGSSSNISMSYQSPMSLTHCDGSTRSGSSDSSIIKIMGGRHNNQPEHPSHSRSHGLKTLGVTEDDVRLAEKLLEHISFYSINKAERILGYAAARMKREKALRLLGASEDEVTVEIPKVLGTLGVAGRRRSYSEADFTAPAFVVVRGSVGSYPRMSMERRLTRNDTENRLGISYDPMPQQRRSKEVVRRRSSDSDVSKKLLRSLRLRKTQAKISPEVELLKARIGMLERRLEQVELDRISSIAS